MSRINVLSTVDLMHGPVSLNYILWHDDAVGSSIVAAIDTPLLNAADWSIQILS